MARKSVARKQKKSKNKTSKLLLYIVIFLVSVIVAMGVFMGGYYIGYESAKTDMEKKARDDKSKRLSMLKKLEDISSVTTKSVKKRLKDVLKKEGEKKDIIASHEYNDSGFKKPPKALKRQSKSHGRKPKLAIIIDDVSTKYHVRAIKSLHMPITMSFLPPSKARPNSAKLASHEKIYMVHLPMEAFNFHAEEEFTLRVSDSAPTIQKRIEYLKRIFPRVRYINNHTGSKFTADEESMSRLIYALKSQHINFIDSRTTAQTKAPQVTREFGMKYMARDVFLDHQTDKASIKKAIKHAVEVAKRHGSAIAIGHPHKNTLSAIAESKELFKDVKLVYINGL